LGGDPGKLHGCWQTADVVFDNLGEWLIGQLADAGRQSLTRPALGHELKRALEQATAAAVRATAEEMSPSGSVSADQVAMVISDAFRYPVPVAPLARPTTLLEGLQAEIARQLAVLDNAELTDTGRTSVVFPGVPVTVLAYRLTGHLVQEIIIRGSSGGPLAPLADQLVDRLRRPGAHRQARDSADDVPIDDPVAVASLLHGLREAGAHQQAEALARRAAAHAPLDNPDAVALLLRSLRAAGARQQAAALAGRAAADAPLGNPRNVAFLLGSLRAAGAHQQAEALARRAAAHVPLDNPRGVAFLLDMLRAAGADKQAAALAGRAAADASLDNPWAVASLLDSLRAAGARQLAAVLAGRAAAHVPLDNPWAVALLLDRLREVGADKQAAVLAGRAAAHVPLDNPAAVGSLLDSLRAAGAHQQAEALAGRAAADTPIDHPAAGSARPRGSVAAQPPVPRLGDPGGVSDSGGRSGGGGHGGGCGGDDGWVPPARPRYLVGQCPESVAVDKPFSLLASINVAASPTSAELELFDVPPEGRDVVLVMYAPGLHVLSDDQQTVHVPADGDSRPARFELRADTPGPVKVSITAWIGGAHLGELQVEITAERDRAPGPHREVVAEITTQPTAGAVSLVVRYDPSQQAYRFEFRDEDNPNEVHSNLAYDPGPVVEQLIADLDSLAAGRSGYSADQTRDYLVNAGARLWQQLVPGQLREQFWDRQHRIRQLTILADKDAVPWELLYPMDPGHDAGFLVEQFPVTRAIFGWRPSRTLRLQPTRFVLPEGSLHEAAVEVEAMRRLLDPGKVPGAVISELTPLTDLISSGKFGLLHFACHNTYEPVAGSSIRLGRVRFTPTLLEVAAIQKALQASAPTVFINACRSAGLAATYNRLDGWASKFLEAGAAAFIGSLWAVSDGASREFAQELYRRLQQGFTLGDAVMEARQTAAGQPDDPTWLAYSVYGDPRATISRSP
jgi:hypothetical protein